MNTVETKIANFIRNHRHFAWEILGVLLLACVGLTAWSWSNGHLEEKAAYVGPEFLVRNATKLVGVAIALLLTFQVDRWLAPTIRTFVHRSNDIAGADGKTYSSAFARSWFEKPEDPRLWISVLYYTISFVGLLLPFL